MKKVLKEFVTVAKNSKNNQEYLILKKRKMKGCDLSVDDLLSSNVNNKMRKFKKI